MEATTARISKDTAETWYVSTPETSYGIFCFNEKGDLFLNSDWGMFGYAWRHYGEGTFKNFLSNCDADYLAGKFAINWNNNNSKAYRFGGTKEKNVTILLRIFIQAIKNDLAPTEPAGKQTK